MRILAIDPGSTESGWVLIDSSDRRPLARGKDDNADVRHKIREWVMEGGIDYLAVEKIESYGMPVGATVFDTVRQVGRIEEIAWANADRFAVAFDLVPRRLVKLHHCGQAKAKDSNIIQALVDRFAPGEPNRGKGTKANPGWFHGFSADVWQSYALAVLVADRVEGRQGVA